MVEGPSSVRQGRRKQVIIATACLLWLGIMGAGTAAMWRYGAAPGTGNHAPPRWPAASLIKSDPHRPTLLMFAHPQCPCTRASVKELALLMARCQGRAAAYVLFFFPADSAEEWAQTDLWRSAAAIPGVQVLPDRAGDEARRFGAATSGLTLLYGADGSLLFGGGITAARGHEGDNEGRSAIAAILTGGDDGHRQTPAYGCSLLDPTSDCHQIIESGAHHADQ